jgi:hypothetical protein
MEKRVSEPCALFHEGGLLIPLAFFRPSRLSAWRRLLFGLFLLPAFLFLPYRTANAQGQLPAPELSPLRWIGEQINYRVSFGVIPAGAARLSVLDTTTLDGRLAVHAISTARSAKAFDIVYKVRDSVQTWFDADSVFSLRFEKKLSEGRYHDDVTVVYEPDHGKVLLWRRGKEKPKQTLYEKVVDVLAAGYKARTVPLAVGDTLDFKTHDVDKVYDLLVFVRSRESVETPIGKFDCFKVEPVLRSGGLFQKEKSARVFIWVTADTRRIPVQMQSKVSFGSVTAVMDDYIPGHGMP